MDKIDACTIQHAAVDVVAQRQREAIEAGKNQDLCVRREIQRHVDKIFPFGRALISRPAGRVLLAATLTCGGFTAFTAQDLPTLVVAILHTAVTLLLFDVVVQMQRRDSQLKTGLYVAAVVDRATATLTETDGRQAG
ncbi:hypothetical protein [Lentzea sp. NBRC 105346]|uniref:hypothetical protein n=1 Tax=Lentzea sp. NBRC 105346 TaxID=3032205 RepID=UPI00255230D6|nr:hypothetical protein [Lentzea sp. NBRC 105346]